VRINQQRLAKKRRSFLLWGYLPQTIQRGYKEKDRSAALPIQELMVMKSEEVA
jgi:hypothetical protein